MEEDRHASGAPEASEPVSILDREDDTPAESHRESPAADEHVEEGANQPAEEAGEPPDDAEEPETETSEPKDDEEDDDAEVDLRDRSKVPLALLKRLHGDTAGEIQRQHSAIAAQKQALEQQAAQVRQQAEELSQLMPQALAALQHNVPPMPARALLASDPFEYWEQRTAHEEAVGSLQALQAQAQAQHQQQFQVQQRQTQEWLQQQHAVLAEKVPTFRDPARHKEFVTDLVQAATHYGITEQEVGKAADQRIIRMALDAGKWQKLQASKAKVQAKVADAPPVVQAPARRVTTQEREAKVTREQLGRLAKTGSVKDAEAFLSRFD